MERIASSPSMRAVPRAQFPEAEIIEEELHFPAQIV